MSPYLAAGFTSCADTAPAIQRASVPDAAIAASLAKQYMQSLPVLADRWANCEECQATEGWARVRWLSRQLACGARLPGLDRRPQGSARRHWLFAADRKRTRLNSSH